MYSGLVCFVLCYIMIEFTYTERYVVVHICTAGTVTSTVYRIVLLCKALNTDGIYIHVNTRVQGNIHIPCNAFHCIHVSPVSILISRLRDAL